MAQTWIPPTSPAIGTRGVCAWCGGDTFPLHQRGGESGDEEVRVCGTCKAMRSRPRPGRQLAVVTGSTGPATEMSVRVRDVGTPAATVIVAVAGEVDVHTAPRLRAALVDAACRVPDRLVLDLFDVRFIDVSGLRTILDAERWASAFDVAFHVHGASRFHTDLLDLLRRPASDGS